MDKQQYINEVLTHIKNKSFREEIEQELNNHISERESYYMDMGYDADKASETAIKKMGSPAESGERLNRIHTSIPSLIISIIMLVAFVAGLVYYFIGYNYVDYTIISTDSEILTLKSIVASFFTFASGAICFRLAYKNRFGIISVILGILYLLSTLAIWIFLPVGGSIFGFFFDFPAVFIDEYFFLFDSELTWGIDSYISNVTICTAFEIFELLLVSTFFFSALINAVLSLHMGTALLKHKNFMKNERKYKRFSAILILITIICAFTMTAEASAEHVKITNQNNLFNQSEYSDYEQAKDTFDNITIPAEMSVGNYVMTVCENEHYMVQIFDDNDDGISESKRISAHFNTQLTDSDLEKITDEMDSEQILEILPLQKATEYWITFDNENTSETLTYTVERRSLFGELKSTYYTFTFENGKQVDFEKEILPF